jgi:hypothetical protein
MSDELERIWKKEAVAYTKAAFSGGTGENHENLQPG